MTETAQLLVTRVFNAPRELVFRCITEAEHLHRFWGPAGMHAPIEHVNIDLRPGGVFEMVLVDNASGAEIPFRSVYTEIDPPAKVAWMEPESGAIATTTLVDLGAGRTEMRIHQTNPHEGMEEGLNSGLDCLEEYLAAVS